MKLYDCKVRLSGSVLNEVAKSKVTPAEVICLRSVHGEDAVVDLKITGNDKRPHDLERARLNKIYGPQVVQALFGAAYGTQLPVELAKSEMGEAPQDLEPELAALMG